MKGSSMNTHMGNIVIDNEVIAQYAGSVAVECFEVSVRCALDRGGVKMAKCDICGKGVHFGNNVSHSHRRSNAIWNSNVKSVKCKVNGGARRMHVCTSCLKSGKVERA